MEKMREREDSGLTRNQAQNKWTQKQSKLMKKIKITITKRMIKLRSSSATKKTTGLLRAIR